MKRLLTMLPPWRWWRSLWALTRRARVHPQAMLLGSSLQIDLGRGCKLGARVRIDPGPAGSVKVGELVWIAADVEIQTEGRLTIGSGTSVQRRSTVNGNTRLGRGCILAPGVFISSGTHPFRSVPHLPIREQEKLLASDPVELAKLDRPVWVQDDCWLGANAVICPGVTIGKGSVVGANAVVTRDVPPFSVVAGCPARVIGQRLDWIPPSRLDPSRPEDHPYLLDACIQESDLGVYIEISVHTPMLAVLKIPADASRLILRYRTAEAITIDVCGHLKNVSRGEGGLELGLHELQSADGFVWCSLALSPDAMPSGLFHVMGLAVVDC